MFGQVRTIVEGGVVLFCGKDVSRSLGYVSPSKAIRDHCNTDGGLKRFPIVDALGRNQMATFIGEGDVYRLISYSKLKKAQKFERWVFDEDLPTIRKTGGFASNEEMFVEEYFAAADPTLKLMLVTSLTDAKK